MAYDPGSAYYKEFATANPTTGAAQNADTTPTATANHNGTDDGSFTLAVTNVTTGRYKITGTVPGGYAAGDVINVSVAATVASIAGVAIVDTQVLNVKTGVVLSAAGLDQISVADPGGIGSQTTFPKILVALYRRFLKKSTLTVTQLKLYADDGSTVNATQAVSDDGTTQTIGAAS